MERESERINEMFNSAGRSLRATDFGGGGGGLHGAPGERGVCAYAWEWSVRVCVNKTVEKNSLCTEVLRIMRHWLLARSLNPFNKKLSCFEKQFFKLTLQIDLAYV